MTTRNRLADGGVSRPKSPQELCDEANERMAADPRGRRDIEWVVIGDKPELRWKRKLGSWE